MTKQQCWALGFEYIAALSPEFRARYWHRWDASRKWATRRGWCIIKVKLVEEDS
jgi:hypothetical protein